MTEPDTETLLMEYKKMKVAELKTELINRNLPTDGKGFCGFIFLLCAYV